MREVSAVVLCCAAACLGFCVCIVLTLLLWHVEDTGSTLSASHTKSGPCLLQPHTLLGCSPGV